MNQSLKLGSWPGGSQSREQQEARRLAGAGPRRGAAGEMFVVFYLMGFLWKNTWDFCKLLMVIWFLLDFCEIFMS